MDIEVLKKLFESDDPAARQQFRDLLVARRPEAWEVVVTRFTPMVCAIARRCGFRDAHDVQQASQETFAELVKDCAQYDPQRPFRPWIARVASNTVRGLQRWEHAQRRLPEGPLISLSDPVGTQDDETTLLDLIRNVVARDPEQVTMFRDLLKRVEHCIPKLPPIEKTVFLLFYRSQLSYAEMSAVLRLPEGTVKARLYDARARLKDCVEY